MRRCWWSSSRSSAAGYPAPARRTIDVVFHDGQGIRVGCPVRVAGLDAGRVVDVDLTEIDETLWARVRISLPSALANKLKQDAKITIQASLAGQSRVNIVSSGRSKDALHIASFGEDRRGELFILAFDGRIHRLGRRP